MCTAMSFTAKDHYFGRTFDLDYRHEESIVIMPRRYPLAFRRAGMLHQHYAMIGTAYVPDGYPLYYDATNEHGLSMAGLRFAGCAHYPQERNGYDNIAPFEIIPWVLARCRTVYEAKALLQRMNPAEIAYSDALPLTPMHWQVDDRDASIAVEPTPDGLMIRENHTRVLTNSPSLPAQLAALARCEAVGVKESMPGGFDSTSRFVRAASVRRACSGVADADGMQLMQMLQTVAIPMGCVTTQEGRLHYTRYLSCCNADTGEYHYITCDDPAVRGVSMRHAELDGDAIIKFPMISSREIMFQN